MNFRAMPRQSMNSISIHPLSGNVCHMLVFSGCAAIRAEYLSTAFLNMKKKQTRTTAVPDMSHHNSCKGIDKYALTPLTVMMTPGIPQSAAATKYKALFSSQTEIVNHTHQSCKNLSSLPDSRSSSILLVVSLSTGRSFRIVLKTASSSISEYS